MKFRIHEILEKIYVNAIPANIAKFAISLDEAMCRYEITSINRMRAFLAQIGHESAQLNRIEENLNYSAERLVTVFPRYFRSLEEAELYANKPKAIANLVYANRLGNRSAQSGDGWKYHGRGLIQLTGKHNYVNATYHMNGLPLDVDFVDKPDLILDPKWASESAAWWWHSNRLNEMADRLGHSDDTDVFKDITKVINGGYNGIDDRLALYERAKEVIK